MKKFAPQPADQKKEIFKILLIFINCCSHHGRSTFFCTLTSLNSISEPSNSAYVLRIINERYEVLWDVRMYVSLCLKLSVNYNKTVAVFAFFHETEWVYKVLGILNLEGQLNCMIGSKVTAILPQLKKKSKTSNIDMLGVYPEAIDWNIALLTRILFCVSVSKEKKHFQSLKTYKMAPYI